MSMQASIAFRDVTKRYGEGRLELRWPDCVGIERRRPVTALEAVSFEVAAGESLAIVGANGAARPPLCV